MKILFVSSGNNLWGLSPIIKSQGESLIEIGHDVDFFLIKGQGFWGYLKNISDLHRKIKLLNPDIIHAHYSLSGFLCAFIFSKPNIVSLMGSDVKKKGLSKVLLNFFTRLIWNKTLVKTDEMKSSLGFKKALVIPNGVNLKIFFPQDKSKSQNFLGWNPSKTHVLFGANPNRPEKNYLLFRNAINKISNINIETHVIQNIEHKDIPVLLNASDVVVLTSIREGSPNIIKEAMACCRPIVATDVGDIDYLLKDVKGCFCTKIHENDVAINILKAIEFSNSFGTTNGLDKIKLLELDSISTAKKIVDVYKSMIK